MMIPRGNRLFSITISGGIAPLNPRLIMEYAHPGNPNITTAQHSPETRPLKTKN